jgi:tight adherence protein B
MRRLLWGAASTVLALSPALFAAEAFAAPDDSLASISHVEPGDNGALSVLVSVPEGAEVDLGHVTMTIGGTKVDASASVAGTTTTNVVKRTTILAIDTSDSMKGPRFAAATAAATSFLGSLPEDVNVGIVTFDAEVRTDLKPTTDRDAARAVIDKLSLARGTRLYDGVLTAIKESGTDGQRSVLVLSDGANTNKTPLADVTKALTDSDLRLDAVALDQHGDDLGPLQSLATAGKGALIPADSAALAQAFNAEAASLARQILVTGQVPASVKGTEAQVSVTLPTGSSALSASTYAEVRTAGATKAPEIAEAAKSIQLPRPVLYGGLAAFGLGIMVLFATAISAAGGDRGERSVEQRINAFGSGAVAVRDKAGSSTSSFNLDEVRDATATMLHRSKSLEARIEARLAGAGSSLKPAEWVLIHAVIAIIAGLAGLLLGNGSVFLLLVGVVVGLALPWLYLGRRKKKRVAAFNTGLADTLQLISGSLSAGMSLGQALDSVVNEGTEPIAGEFRRVLIETRLGVPLEAALEGISHRIESADFEWVVMAIRIQREVGGNLAELLLTVASTLRERDYLRRQVKSLSAEGLLSAYILIGLPIGVAIFLVAFRGEYIRPLYTTGIGFLLIAAAVVLLSMAAWLMKKIVTVEV